MPFAAICGDVLVGVRSNDDDVHESLRGRFGRLAVDTDAPEPDYTVFVPPADADHGPQPLHRLYWGNKVVATSRGVDELVDVLAAHLDGYAARPTGDVMRFDLVGVVTPEGAALLPRHWRSAALEKRRVLGRQGIEVLHQPLMHVDTATGELLHDPSGATRSPIRLVAIPGEVSSWRPADMLLLLSNAAHPTDLREPRLTAADMRALARLATLLPEPVVLTDLPALTALVPAAGR